MNNERYNQIIDDVYKRYLTETMFHPENNWLEDLDGMDISTGEIKKVYRQYALKEFINKCKTDVDFSQKWGLNIEERELTDKERLNTLIQNEQRLIYEKVQSFKNLKRKTIKDYLDEKNIPTRLITLTYNNEKIEIYE